MLLPMIVKVKLGGAGNGPPSWATVTSRDGSLAMRLPASHVLLARLNGLREAYFHAEHDRKCDVLDIGERVSDQSW